MPGLLLQRGLRYGEHRGVRVCQAVTAHLAVPQVAGRAASAGLDDQQVISPAGTGTPVARIGRERLRQILHSRGISFQRTRTWKESADPDKDTRLDRIEEVTSKFANRCFAFDQFGPFRSGPPTAPRGQSSTSRRPATYHRTHGIRYFHGCYSLGDDQLWGVARRRKGGNHTLAVLKSLRLAPSASEVHRRRAEPRS